MNRTPKPGENTWLWLAKLASGLFILILLIVHLVANHLVVEGGLMTYTDVIRYLSNPWIALMEMNFLVFVVVHALLGTRSVILDLRLSARLQRFFDRTFVVLGVVAIAYGIWLMQVLVRQGA